MPSMNAYSSVLPHRSAKTPAMLSRNASRVARSSVLAVSIAYVSYNAATAVATTDEYTFTETPEGRLPTEIVSLSFVPSHCRTLHVRSWRSHCAAIGTLNCECATLHNLRMVPAERARFQYRDERLLLHTLLPMCAPASNVSHSAIHGQWRGSRHVRSAINMQDLTRYRVGVLRGKEHCGSRNLIRR